MNEVKRKATARYFEQEIWNNLSKLNSFEDRRLNLKCNKLGKDESITVKSWNQEQLLMLRRNKKLHDLLNSQEHFTAQRSSQVVPQSRHLSLPTLASQQRPHSTASCTGGSTRLSPTSNEPMARPRSHTDQTSLKTSLSVKQSDQAVIYLPAVSESKVRRSSQSARPQGTTLSDSELTSKHRRTSWTKPSTQLHQRVNLTSSCD